MSPFSTYSPQVGELEGRIWNLLPRGLKLPLRSAHQPMCLSMGWCPLGKRGPFPVGRRLPSDHQPLVLWVGLHLRQVTPICYSFSTRKFAAVEGRTFWRQNQPKQLRMSVHCIRKRDSGVDQQAWARCVSSCFGDSLPLWCPSQSRVQTTVPSQFPSWVSSCAEGPAVRIPQPLKTQGAQHRLPSAGTCAPRATTGPVRGLWKRISNGNETSAEKMQTQLWSNKG